MWSGKALSDVIACDGCPVEGVLARTVSIFCAAECTARTPQRWVLLDAHTGTIRRVALLACWLLTSVLLRPYFARYAASMASADPA